MTISESLNTDKMIEQVAKLAELITYIQKYGEVDVDKAESMHIKSVGGYLISQVDGIILHFINLKNKIDEEVLST